MSERLLRAFRDMKYTYTPAHGWQRHNWSIRGPRGGVSFSAQFQPEKDPEGEEASCGLEFHHAYPEDFHTEEAPHHTRCWLLGGACWHDGTSLYATETMWPYVRDSLFSRDHDRIFVRLASEYCRHWDDIKKRSETP